VACGPGTAFPLEVTLDQIAEIFYRVKDAHYAGGNITWEVFGSPVTYPAPTAAPANRALEVNGTTYQKRGYTKVGASTYGGVLYDAGNGVDYSDIDREIGIWGGDTWHGSTAFSYEADDPNNTEGSTSQWWGLVGAGANVRAVFGGRIAVVRNDPSDEVFAATNRFFIEFEFAWFDYNTVLNFGGGTNIYDGVEGDWSANATVACDYVIRIQTGDVTCPIYFSSLYPPVGGSDVIHAATAWWPYATTTGDPAWDDATGAPANGGPGA
jgi:hypothetical protein